MWSRRAWDILRTCSQHMLDRFPFCTNYKMTAALPQCCLQYLWNRWKRRTDFPLLSDAIARNDPSKLRPKHAQNQLQRVASPWHTSLEYTVLERSPAFSVVSVSMAATCIRAAARLQPWLYRSCCGPTMFSVPIAQRIHIMIASIKRYPSIASVDVWFDWESNTLMWQCYPMQWIFSVDVPVGLRNDTIFTCITVLGLAQLTFTWWYPRKFRCCSFLLQQDLTSLLLNWWFPGCVVLSTGFPTLCSCFATSPPRKWYMLRWCHRWCDSTRACADLRRELIDVSLKEHIFNLTMIFDSIL